MKNQEIGKKFRKVVKGKNFITPYVIDYYEIKNGVCELSKGRGFFSDYLYGVTVVQNGIKNDEISTCFQEEEEAKNYINSLK